MVMGTEVQRTSYLPGFCTMRDLNEDAGGCWSQNYVDTMSAQNIYNGYQLRPSNGYSEYDKEMFKMTMLEHEAIFRKQVYELHRIYRIQKDILAELKTGASGHLPHNTSQSNSFSSQIPFEGPNKMFQMAHLPEAPTSNNGTPLLVTDDNKPILNFLNESNMQYGPVSIGKEISLKDGDMFDSNQKGLSKRMFDLQLPDNVYIDCEDKRSENRVFAESSLVNSVPFDRIQGSGPEHTVNLNLAMAEGCYYGEDCWKSDINTRSGSTTRSMADLNESAREVCFGKTSGPVSAKMLTPKTSLAENQGVWLPMRSNTHFSGLPSAFLKGKCCVEGTSSNHLRVEDDETSWGWTFFHNKAGQNISNMKPFCPGSSTEKFSNPYPQVQLNQISHGILSLHQNKSEEWFKPQHEISRRSPPDGRSAIPFPNSSDTLLEYTDTTSPFHSYWTKPANGYSRVPLPVPSLQYLNVTTTKTHGNPSDEFQYSGNLQSHSSAVGPTSYQNGFNHGASLGYSPQWHHPTFTFSEPNLGGRSEGNLEGCGPQKSVHVNQTVRDGLQNGFSTMKINESAKCEDFSGALPWLRGKQTTDAASLMELDLPQDYSQPKCSGTVMNLKNGRSQETEKHDNLFNLQDLLTSSHVNETTTTNVTSDGQRSRKFFGFSIPHEHSQTALTHGGEKDEPKLPRLETEIPHGYLVSESSSIASGDHVNLNFDLNSSDLSAEGEMLEAPSRLPVSTAAPQIDLEETIALGEEEEPDEVSAKEAAESILLISSDKSSRLNGVPCHRSSSVSYNNLHWFAEVVSSNPEFVKGTSVDSLDSFVLLTLELEETKPEEFWCRSCEGQDQKDDEDGKSSIASLLLAKRRRGQARRRQKRDFQREILPGIASLSRHEVTEDLQTIGAPVKASGRGRVGRRPRSLAVIEEEIQQRPPPQPSPPPRPPVDGRNMIGWGRTTRRCRRQRLPPVTAVAASLT